MRTNEDHLVQIAVMGEISPPSLSAPYRPDASGQARVMYGMAGIAYNVRVGDPAFGWEADHLEPGVSIHNRDLEADYAMHYLTCVGNEATVATGDACGAKGVVSGEHARLLIDFAADVLDRMCIGDRMVIKTHGVGLQLLQYPHITVRKCSPRLIEAMGLEHGAGGTLRVPVTHEIPSQIMGSGLELIPEFVDQDLMTEDRTLMEELGLTDLRLGDVVAIRDQDHSHGRGYSSGATTIGLINHGDSFMTGHGPGVMTLLSCPTPHIEPFIEPEANIAKYLRIGRWSEER